MSTSADAAESANDERQQLAQGELHEVTIEKIVYGGDGLAHIGRQAVFVPYAAVGDHLRVKIVSLERNYARAVIDEIVWASPTRREPTCAHFGICGGCQLQHITYAAQLEAKASFIRESLRRLGGIEWNDEIKVRSASEFGYRSRAELKVSHNGSTNPQIGYYRSGTQEICEVTDCPILLPAVNRELHRLRVETSMVPADATRIFLTAGDDEVILTPGTGENARTEAIDSMGTAYQCISGIKYGFGVRSFFQGNRLLVDELVNEAIGGNRGRFAVDLYAGVGLFSLQLAKTFDQVCAVEGNRFAAAHGAENARANGVGNVKYEPISVEAWLKYKSGEYPQPDLVLLDPPRAGAGPQVLSRVLSLKSPAISYISCDPATLARDLKQLLSEGYSIESVTALDMFPQTFHVEAVVHLKLS
ncbi:MAG: class I SAM-dependent RNA methyltransferase [Acidobacteria bacterium]|nr:class I SAM-dependent RNA methyltransferase [Acidobacteriota bacterium]